VSTTPNTPNFLDTPGGPLPEPTELRAGDSWKWQRAFDGFPSSAWALQYILNGPGVARFAFPSGATSAASDGQAFNVAATGTQTAAIVAGKYDIYAILTNSATSEQRTFELESVLITPNIAGGVGTIDSRSFVKRTLDALEAAIDGDTSILVQEYEVHGRRVQYMKRTELLELRAQFKTEYRQEQINSGEFVPKRTARVSFGTST
jgi:hypothetical protein